jgi:hypothetical protein
VRHRTDAKDGGRYPRRSRNNQGQENVNIFIWLIVGGLLG